MGNMQNKIALIITGLLLLPALSVAGGEPLPIEGHEAANVMLEQLYAGSQCGDTNGDSASWIATSGQLNSVYQNLRKGKIGGPELKAPKVNFKQEGVLVISMGQQRTGGYGVKLHDETLAVEGNRAIVKILWLEPAPGAIQIQVITSPCLLVKVPLGSYSRIEVVDQTRTKRFELEI